MINLMPPDLKEQIRFAKMNRVALNYTVVVVVLVLVLGGIFAWALVQVKQQTNDKSVAVAEKLKEVNSLKAQVLPKSQDASDRISAIKYVQNTHTRFSLLIADIAKVIPDGVKLNQLQLTGNDKMPVQVTITANQYDQVLAFRNAIITSPRISAADIVTITSAGNVFNATVIMGFKPGEAK